MQKYIIEYETKNMWSVMFNRSPKKTVSVLICVKKKKKVVKTLNESNPFEMEEEKGFI